MTSKESRTLRFTLSAEVIGNENATHSIIGEFIMPLDASDDLVWYAAFTCPATDSAE